MSSFGEGKRRNVIAEWHVAWLAEWHNYAECNICRLTKRNKLDWKVHPFFGPNQFSKSSDFFNLAGSARWQPKSHEGFFDFSLSISLLATKILLALISRASQGFGGGDVWHFRLAVTGGVQNSICHVEIGSYWCLIYFFALFPYIKFSIIMSFPKPCHMPFRKLSPFAPTGQNPS